MIISKAKGGGSKGAMPDRRSPEGRLALLIEVSQQHCERLRGVERALVEIGDELLKMKSDVVLLENKVLTVQTEILTIRDRSNSE